MSATQKLIAEFLDADDFAVAGASSSRAKYGNKVLRAYIAHGRRAHPVNPNEDEVEGLKTYPDLSSLLRELPGVDRVSIITPPPVTERIVEDAIATNGAIRYLWMQPGAHSRRAIERAEGAGMKVLAGGPCVLVELR